MCRYELDMKISKIFLLKLAASELLNQKKISLFFVLNLSVGLLSFLLLDSFERSLQIHLENNSKSIMTADIRVSGLRGFSAQEKTYLQENVGEANFSQRLSYLSMSRHGEKTLMVQVNAVDAKFPLYGGFLIKNFNDETVPLSKVYADLQSPRSLAVFPEIVYALDLKEGSILNIRGKPYTVKYIVAEDAGSGNNFFSAFAPKVYVLRTPSELAIQNETGVNFFSSSYLRIPGASDSSVAEGRDIRATLSAMKKTDVSPLRVRVHSQSSGGAGRILSYTSNYLSLLSLVALFLAGISTAYLFRNFIHQRLKETAILQSLGLDSKSSFILSILEILFIGLAASLLTSFLGYFLTPYLPQLLSAFLPKNFSMQFSFQSVIFTFLISLVGSYIFCMPVLLATRKFSLSFLFNSELRFYKLSAYLYYSSIASILLFFYGLAWWLSQSIRVSSIFTFFFFSFVILTFYLARFFLWGLARLQISKPFLLRFSLKSILYYRTATLFYFVSISLCVMLISMIMQLESALYKQTKAPDNAVIPTFFFYNITEESSLPFLKYATQLSQEKQKLTPLVSSRLTHINNKPILISLPDAKEEASGASAEQGHDEHRQQHLEWDSRRINITYRDYLLDTEEIAAGHNFTFTDVQTALQEKIFQVSLEKVYAKERGLKLGDILSFSLIDIPFSFQAKVINFRKVNWNTFQPNFFIVVEPGVLEKFPKTYLSSLAIEVDDKEKVQIQSSLTKVFPDISILDIKKIIEKISAIISQLALLVKVLAFFSMALGLFMLYCVVSHQVYQRRHQVNMLKVLGTAFYKVRLLTLAEYILLGVLSIFSGLVSGFLIYFFVSYFIFEDFFSFSPYILLVIFASVILLIAMVSLLAAHKILRSKPITLIKESI